MKEKKKIDGCILMEEDSRMTYLIEIGKFREEIKKVVIPYDKFFRKFNDHNNYEEKMEFISSTEKF